MNASKASPFALFKFFALAEAVTWTLLISALILRATANPSPIVLTIAGSIHGAVFLGYGVISALVGVNQRWGFWKIALGTVLAIVPYATIPFERAVQKRGDLEGEWRKTHSGEKRDDHWFDRLFRWFINRPGLLALALVAVVVVIFSVLVYLGPPSEWAK